ncbi:MAG: uL15 family ribosomal protein [Clostridia bacterium]|nr:uL15 family ribosomal protein [Clostridia bacterium]
MIIACGVLSCVAVLLGIIILEIAIDRKEKRKAKKQAEEQALQVSPVENKAEEPAQTSSEEKPSEEHAKTEEPIIAEEPIVAEEQPTDEPVQTDEPIIEDEPVEVVVPASEPIIEEAPAPVEEIAHVEDIIAEEPAVVVNKDIIEEQALPVDNNIAEPAQAEEPIVTEEVAVVDEPVAAEEPIIEEEPAQTEEPIAAEEPVIAEEPAPEVVAEEPVIAAEPVAVEDSVEPEKAEEPIPVEETTIETEPVIVAEPAIETEPAIAEVPAEEIVIDDINEVEEPAPEVIEEVAIAESNVVEDIVEPEIDEDDTAELNGVDDPEDEVASELKVVVKDGQTRYIVIKYSKSFEAKLIQGTDDAKRYYSELKNCLLSYGVKSNMVKSRMSWKWEAFRYGRKTLARLRLRGKTISVVLALNPDDYKDTKYLVESLADVQCYSDTPALYRIKSERRLKYTKELIAKMMQDNGLSQKPDFVPVNYAPLYPYDTTENLVERKLIKVLTDEDAQSGEVFKPSDIRKSVKAQDVDNILQDEIAVELIEKLDGVSDRTKSGIINIDTLSQNFKDGETVTIEEIRKRIKGYNKVTYIKVLARGTLDKRLTVEADDFSLQAVKMIVLIGGKVIKNKLY